MVHSLLGCFSKHQPIVSVPPVKGELRSKIFFSKFDISRFYRKKQIIPENLSQFGIAVHDLQSFERC